MFKRFSPKYILFTLLAAALVIVPFQEGRADLSDVGPTSEVNGFPLWYMDANGLALTISTDPALGLADPVVPGNAFSQQIGFGAEAFYFAASATAGPCDVENALEAFFVNENPVDGDQMVFARLRIRCDITTAGTYTITHPYGTSVFDVAAPGVRAINSTTDEILFQIIPTVGPISILATPNLGQQYIQNFLVAVNPAPPAGFLGDPAVEQTVTGSPTGNNFVRVEGPGVDATQTLFSISGQIIETNTTPVANAQTVLVAPDTETPITLTATDPDAPPQVLTFAIATDPINGTLGPLNPDTGEVTYTPNAGFLGPDNFTFTVSDGEITSAAATVTITVGDATPAAFRPVQAGGPPLLTSFRRPGLNNDRFVLFGRMNLALPNNGIDPVNEDVTIQIAARVLVTIPAGSFVDLGAPGFRFQGTVGGIPLLVRIIPEADGAFRFRAVGTSANLPPRARVPVTITIGDDTVSRQIASRINNLR